MNLVKRRKVEIILDEPLTALVANVAERAGISGYTLVRALGGSGRSGPWRDDRITRADTKIVFMSVMPEEKAERFLQELEPALDTHGLLAFSGPVDVLRPERFS